MKTTFAKLILISAAAMGTLLFALMPDQPTPVHKAANLQQQLNRLSRKLAPTADQQGRIIPVLTVRDVLTDTQRAAYDQMQQEARERAKAKKQGTVSN